MSQVRLPKFEQWEVVELVWLDSGRIEEGWYKPRKKDIEIDGCSTVGMVYAQAPDRITIVLSRDTKRKEICSAITIPTCAITDYNRLVRTKKT